MSNPGEIQTKDTSVDEDVRAAFAELNNSTPSASSEPVQTDLLASEPKEGETAEQAAQRVRDDQGRFAKEPKESNRVKADKPAGEQPVVAAVDPNTPVIQASSVKAPDGWTAPMKAEFGKLPPNVQAEINRREQEMHRAVTTRDEHVSLGKRVKEASAPYLATIRAEGGDEFAAFQQYLNTAHILRSGSPQQKAQALHVIAQQFNVDLGVPLQPGSSQPPAALTPQQVRAEVQAEIASEREKREQLELSREIETFASDPANTHYETLKPIMAGLLSSGAAGNLKDAYDQALWANPDIRSTLTASQVAQADQTRANAAREKAEAAKRASGSIAGGPGGTAPINGGVVERSLDEELRANFRAAHAGRI